MKIIFCSRRRIRMGHRDILLEATSSQKVCEVVVSQLSVSVTEFEIKLKFLNKL